MLYRPYDWYPFITSEKDPSRVTQTIGLVAYRLLRLGAINNYSFDRLANVACSEVANVVIVNWTLSVRTLRRPFKMGGGHWVETALGPAFVRRGSCQNAVLGKIWP